MNDIEWDDPRFGKNEYVVPKWPMWALYPAAEPELGESLSILKFPGRTTTGEHWWVTPIFSEEDLAAQFVALNGLDEYEPFAVDGRTEMRGVLIGSHRIGCTYVAFDPPETGHARYVIPLPEVLKSLQG